MFLTVCKHRAVLVLTLFQCRLISVLFIFLYFRNPVSAQHIYFTLSLCWKSYHLFKPVVTSRQAGALTFGLESLLNTKWGAGQWPVGHCMGGQGPVTVYWGWQIEGFVSSGTWFMYAHEMSWVQIPIKSFLVLVLNADRVHRVDLRLLTLGSNPDQVKRESFSILVRWIRNLIKRT